MKVILFAGAEIRDYSFCESYMDGADAMQGCVMQRHWALTPIIS